ncbi:DUF2264 domain-containing protein [Moritella yayanosii]|uniref:DUF2264 domain-containing protein n=1 Tax=Moritella yayanosii TaxID=69539 RepID=A0A330LSN9_9GAMM|nr:DUF2264 domain-containing protein [Moritella yayanosii]SQD79987.1 conserved protein of unknown function, absent from Moritella but conserved in Photobacterium [Moritella yayanosii]
MTVKIVGKPRPTIPYEHPTLSMHWHNLKQNVQRQIIKGARYSRHDAALQATFSNDETGLAYLCEQLMRYVSEAFEHYAVWDYSHAYYPGRPSQQSARVDAMEGVSRVLPTLASWVHNRPVHDSCIQGLDNKDIDVAVILRRALLAGTNPLHKGYWGELNDFDQRTCESADLALALWLSKNVTWDLFTCAEQQQVIRWFKQVSAVETVDNNWHLFALTVEFVILSLTGEDTISHAKFERIKEFHVGGGWFRDGAKGNYDFYNAWGFHYSLYWLQQIIPDYDSEFITQTLAQFSNSYRYFFTPDGLPLFGRSACYRLAAAAPLLAAVDSHAGEIQVGEAKRAFATNLKYFISQGAMRNGAPTQGLFADDARLMDNYSGPASSFWSLRALNIAFYCGDRIGLWDAKETPLMVEQGDFELNIKEINAKIIGVQETQEVVVLFLSEYVMAQTPLTRRLESQRWQDKVIEMLFGRARRPKNNLLRKGVTCYSSKMAHLF